MGRNNQQRRAAKAKARKGRPGGSAAPAGSAFGMPPRPGPGSGWGRGGGRGTGPLPNRDALIENEVELAFNFLLRFERLTQEGHPERAEEALFELARSLSEPVVRAGLVARFGNNLAEAVGQAWVGGWQPADLLRIAARRVSVLGQAVIADAVAEQLRQFAPSTITPSWRGQLEQADVRAWWPSGQHHLVARAGRTEGGLVEVLLQSLAALDVLSALPIITSLDPLPGRWRAPRHTGPAATVDARLLDRVRALLAKAESTPYEAEADTFTAGAQALMARHSIDQAMLAASGGAGRDDAPRARRVGIDRPYEPQKVLLLDVVASANRCRTVWSKGLGFVTVIGFTPDLDATETIFTSLLLQSTRSLTGHGSRSTRHGQSRTRVFRQSFLSAFAQRIGQRLREVADEITTAASGETSTATPIGPSRALVQVLAARSSEVDETVGALFPQMVDHSVGSRTDAEGWAAGVLAADTANLFSLEELPGD